MLSRRIPLIQGAGSTQPPVPPPKLPVSALPLHLQRSNTVASGSGTPPRVQSPQLGPRPMSPPVSAGSPAPYRPSSPFNRARAGTAISLSTVPQSPTVSAPPPPNPAVRRPDETLDIDLIVRRVPRDQLFAEKPFKVDFTITVSAPVTPTASGQPRRQRVLSLVVQHVRPPRPALSASTAPSAGPAAAEVWSPRLPSSGFSTPSPYATPHRGDFPDTLAQKLLYASPRQVASDLVSDAGTEADGGDITPAPPREDHLSVLLPPPFAVLDPGASDPPTSPTVQSLGPSALFLPQLRLLSPEVGGAVGAGQRESGHDRNWSESTVDSEMDSDLHETVVSRMHRVLGSQDFELEFLPLNSGFATVGGLRVLIVEDRIVEGDEAVSDRPIWLSEVRTLQEWEVVAEIWVHTVSTQ